MSRLNTILRTKMREVQEAESQLPLAELVACERDAPPTLGFSKALRNSRHPIALIAEVKKASPSMGVIRANFDPVSIAKDYASVGADCLSVLTDVEYFQGSPQNLMQIRKEVSLPLLRKDFIIDRYQLFEARTWGADAILLIVAAFDGSLGAEFNFEKMVELADEAGSLGLDVLMEVHDAEEMAAVGSFDLIGINNRHLATFETDLKTTAQLAQLAPPGATLVSESALETYEDVRFAMQAGAHAVLIGTAFCRAENIRDKVLETMNW